MDLYEIFITHNRNWSLEEVVCFSILFLIVALYAGNLLHRKQVVFSQIIAGLAIVLFLGIVFGSTVLTRKATPMKRYKLSLFWSWRKVFENHNMVVLEEILLNCILLFPLGLLLPVALRKRVGALEGFLYGFLVSVVIETSQLLLHRGLFEWDDMIHNAIGCMLGGLVMRIMRKKADDA